MIVESENIAKGGFFAQLFTLCRKNILKIVSVVLVLISTWLGAIDYKWEKETWYGIPFGPVIITIIALLIIVLQMTQQKKEKNLEEELDVWKVKYHKVSQELSVISVEIPAIIKNIVIEVYENLGLESNDRITLYLFSQRMFFPCARYSKDPNKASIKRTKYDMRKGIIGKIWSNGWFFDNQFPDPADVRQYKKYSREKYELSPGEVANLSMQAVLYCGLRISDSLNRTPVAILVVESNERSRIKENEIRGVIEKECKKFVPLLENQTIRSHIPNQSIIDQEEGF